MELLSCLIAGLVNSGQLDPTQSDRIKSPSGLVEYAASHSHVRWDAAADAAPLIHRPGGVIEATTCVQSSDGMQDGAVRKMLEVKGVSSISRARNLSVNGRESIENGTLKTSIRESSVGIVSQVAIVETIQLPVNQSSLVCGLISGVVGD